VVAADRPLPIDAVVAVDEAGVVAAALAGEQLGLAHNPPAAARATRDKISQRRLLDAAEVPQPGHRVVSADGDVAAAAAELGYPVVVKAPCLSASRGVLRADGPEAARAAARVVREVMDAAGAPTGEPLLVEAFVPGREVAVEAVLTAPGRVEVLAVLDKPDPMDGPTFEETILVTPSRLERAHVAEVERAIVAAAGALGLSHGPIHAEARVTPGGEVAVLEVAARTIGGLCGRMLSLGTAMSLEEVVLRNAAGLPLAELTRQLTPAGVAMLPVPRDGTFRRVDGVESARGVPGVTEVEITVAAGTPVRALPFGDRYVGFVFAAGATPDDVERNLREATSRLTIVID